MKNVIKKISALAMSFALIGIGTAVTKTSAAKSDNTLTAYAADAYCPSHGGGVYTVTTKRFTGKTNYFQFGQWKEYEYTQKTYCNVCNRLLSTKKWKAMEEWYWDEIDVFFN